MAVIEKTFAMDETVAKQFDDLFSCDEQSNYINEIVAKQVYETKKNQLIEKMRILRQSRPKLDGISTTDMIYRLRNGGEL